MPSTVFYLDLWSSSYQGPVQPVLKSLHMLTFCQVMQLKLPKRPLNDRPHCLKVSSTCPLDIFKNALKLVIEHPEVG